MTHTTVSSAPDGNPIGDTDSIDGVVEIARNAVPGSYRIDHISADPGSTVPMSRTWGSHQITQWPDHAGRPAVDRLTDENRSSRFFHENPLSSDSRIGRTSH